MIIYYKKETPLIEYLKSIRDVKFYKEGFLEKIGFKTKVYPDIYFHSGALNSFSKTLIENSKHTIVNSNILKNNICKQLLVKPDNIYVIFPATNIKKFKKKELKKPFYKKHNIEDSKKLIYFTAKNFQKSGFERYCKILQNLEAKNWIGIVTVKIDKDIDYINDVLLHYKLNKKVILAEDEVFDIADIFLLPTSFINFSNNILKAMANKCVVFLPKANYATELLDMFAIMENPNDYSISYKIDMLLRAEKELKNIQKENYKIAKKYTFEYQQKKLQNILAKISL